jgi:phosphoribosylcarboxyaminoimidazole (NCAIR) mutase
MFSFVTNNDQRERLSQLIQRLSDAKTTDIVGLFDYDLTMAAKKNPRNFDDAPLEPKHHAFLTEFAASVGRVVVQTARGQKTTLNYLRKFEQKFGALHNVILASNSGHLVLPDLTADKPNATYVAIPAYEGDRERLDAVVKGIHGVAHQLQAEYSQLRDCPLFIVDDRELCGAVIYQIEGKKDSPQVLGFHSRVENLVRELPAGINELVQMPGKDREVVVDGAVFTQGYVDFKPKGRNGLSGMDKGYTTDKILSDFDLVNKDSILIVAGDSQSDYPMMQKAAELVRAGKARAAICIDVGGEIEDTDHILDGCGKDRDKIVGISLKKDEGYPHAQVDNFYKLLRDIKRSFGPERTFNSRFGRSPRPGMQPG